MNRTLLIARREYAAYAKTVGFWLSLLAFPLFAVIGGAVPILMRSSEPVRQVVLIEEGPQAAGLAASVRDALRLDGERRADAARRAQAEAAKATGMPPEALAKAPGNSGGALAGLRRQRLAIVDTPPALLQAPSGQPQEDEVRRLLGDDAEQGQRLDAVVFLTRQNGQPGARVWSRRATDDTVEDFVRDALRSANRRQVFETAGIDQAVVTDAERFRPDVKVFSPKSQAGGGLVSFRDRLPGIIGLASGFLLWSLIITGASILLNSVMEEKANKILEVLLSSASATEILAGKVLGVAFLTLTVLATWGGLGAAGLLAFAPQYAPTVGSVLLDGGMVFYLLAYAVGGYLMYAVLFAAIGAFCETPRDAQTLMGPIMMVLTVPILIMTTALQSPDAPIVRILSLVPLFTPFVMPARIAAEPPMIEVAGSLFAMFAFALLMVWVAGRAFRAGALSDVKLSWKSFAGAVKGGGK